jgi:hypothetical protein
MNTTSEKDLLAETERKGRGQTAPDRTGHQTAAVKLRLTPDERLGLARAAERQGVTVSRLLRRAVREMINQAPDLFDDGVMALQANARQLAAIGRNLNMTARAINAGDVVVTQREIAEDVVQLQKDVDVALIAYRDLVAATRKRWVIP